LWWHPRKQSWVTLKITIEVLSAYKSEYNFEASDLKPIDLTPEILEHNGFTKEERIKGLVEWISEDGRVILRNDPNYLNSENIWGIHVDSPDMSTICTAELSYLHQLQHIYKHCEIEKTYLMP
jgi:hypothetical protein